MEPVIDLDDPEAISRVDLSGMLTVVEWFPNQLREALDIGNGDVQLPDPAGVDSIVVLGMGGSGISGDVVAALTADSLPVPVLANKAYTLPALVGKDTLVFAVSYSGNTEETLDTVHQSLERGARVVAVSSGGTLTDLAEAQGLPLFRIPGGLQPRASLGYLTAPIVCALERMGLVSGLVDQIRGAATMLEERAREYVLTSPLDENPTKRIAKDLLGYLPVVYGSEGRLAVAAHRWKCQLNENAKVPAFDNWFPELNHNETVGWQHLEEICSRTHLLVLREKGEHPRVSTRIDITSELLEGHLGHVTQVCARGANGVERLLDLIYFGDWLSVYLALALGQDPTPVTRIEELKKRLAGKQ